MTGLDKFQANNVAFVDFVLGKIKVNAYLGRYVPFWKGKRGNGKN